MKKTKTKVQSTVPVTIVLKDGIVQCTPDCVYLCQGQTIEWKCKENFPFAIHLGYDSPFEKVHHQALQQKSIRLKIAKDTCHGRYKYVVAIFDGKQVWIEDPYIIIRR